MRAEQGRRAGLAAVAVSAALLPLAGCGSTAKPAVAVTGPTSAATASSAAAATATTAPAVAATDSCSVITQAEAGAALGQQARPPVRGKATVEGGVACVFYGPDVPAGTSPDIPVADSVRVVLVTGHQAVKYFKDYRRQVAARTITGLSDQAYYEATHRSACSRGTLTCGSRSAWPITSARRRNSLPTPCPGCDPAGLRPGPPAAGPRPGS
jgi:hypothetical protein